MYRCIGVLIREPSTFSFNINCTLLPLASESDYFFYACDELIEPIRVFGIGVGHNKSAFQDGIEIYFPEFGIDNRRTKLALFGCSEWSKPVLIIILKRMNSYCVMDWGSCIGEYHCVRSLALCIIIKLRNIVCYFILSPSDMRWLLHFGWRLVWVERWLLVRPICR